MLETLWPARPLPSREVAVLELSTYAGVDATARHVYAAIVYVTATGRRRLELFDSTRGKRTRRIGRVGRVLELLPSGLTRLPDEVRVCVTEASDGSYFAVARRRTGLCGRRPRAPVAGVDAWRLLSESTARTKMQQKVRICG